MVLVILVYFFVPTGRAKVLTYGDFLSPRKRAHLYQSEWRQWGGGKLPFAMSDVASLSTLFGTLLILNKQLRGTSNYLESIFLAQTLPNLETEIVNVPTRQKGLSYWRRDGSFPDPIAWLG